MAELRESLVEEGRRRRQLYEERKWAVQSEFRRLLAERAAVGEKEGMIRLLVKVWFATVAYVCINVCVRHNLCTIVAALSANSARG